MKIMGGKIKLALLSCYTVSLGSESFLPHPLVSQTNIEYSSAIAYETGSIYRSDMFLDYNTSVLCCFLN